MFGSNLFFALVLFSGIVEQPYSVLMTIIEPLNVFPISVSLLKLMEISEATCLDSSSFVSRCAVVSIMEQDDVLFLFESS